MQILTPSGFKPFNGVKRYWHNNGIVFTFSDGSKLQTSQLHRFVVDGNEIYSKDVNVGDDIGKVVINKRIINEGDYYYDPVNVSDGSVFKHDNKFVSHNTFIGASNTLIESDVLLALQSAPPLKSMHSNSLRVFENPQEDHFYIMTVDVSQGRGQDYSAFSIVDCSQKPYRQVATYHNNKISPLLFPNIIVQTAKHYNNALLIVENNGPGQIVCNTVYYDFEYENMFVESATKAGGVGVTTTKKVKNVGVSNLKDLIESHKLVIPDSETIVELSCFEAKGSSYQASNGQHDDLVMTLVLFAWFVSTEAFGDFDEVELRQMIYENRMQEIEEELLDFGFLSSTQQDDSALHPEYQRQREELEEWMKL